MPPIITLAVISLIENLIKTDHQTMDEHRQEAPGDQPKGSKSPLEEDMRPRIVGIEEAPEYLLDNKYLVWGYRKNFRQFSDILKSIFMAHHETLNIWTHFLGSIALIGVLYFILSEYLPHHSVIVHLKELSFRKPNLEGSLAELKASMLACQPTSARSVQQNLSNEHGQSHLCDYISSIQTQNFSSSFMSLHSGVVKGLEKARENREHKGVIDTIMHAVK